jgi:hypothetical protein
MNEAQLHNINEYRYRYLIAVPCVPSSSILQYIRNNKSRGFIPLHIYDEKIILICKLYMLCYSIW